MNFTRFCFVILIQILPLFHAKTCIPYTYSILKLNNSVEDENIIAIAFSKDAQFVVKITLGEHLILWDLFHENNVLFKQDIAFDESNTEVNGLEISKTSDHEFIFIAVQTLSYINREDTYKPISKVNVIKYNLTTQKITPYFYTFTSFEEITNINLQDYVLNIITTKGYLHNIDLITHQNTISNLFENLDNKADAIAYNAIFPENNLIIIANQYKNPQPHRLSIFQSNGHIKYFNLPFKYNFVGFFYDGSLLLKDESKNFVSIYNSNTKTNSIIEMQDNAILDCEVLNNSIAFIKYEKENKNFLKFIFNHTKPEQYVTFELPDTFKFLCTCPSQDNKILKIILQNNSNKKIFLLEFVLFNLFRYVMNTSTNPNHRIQISTGNYKINYSNISDKFEIIKTPSLN